MANRTHLLRRLVPAAIVGFVLGLLVVPGALGELFYTDSTGDSGPAPDITDLHVVDDPAGNITFDISTNQQVLASGARISVYVDSDRDATTGMRHGLLGVDHEFSYGGGLGHPFLFHYSPDGNLSMVDFRSTLSVVYRSGLTARVNKSDLDVADRFRFVVEAVQEGPDEETIGLDVAPDDGLQEYVLARTPPTLVVGNPTPTGRATAGRMFVVIAPVRHGQGGSLASAKVACGATAGVTRIRSTGSIAAGKARCRMRLPTGARGKQLRGTIAVSIPGTSWVSRSFSFAIR